MVIALWLGLALAQQAPAHPMDAACHHCHDDPHSGRGGTACAECHTPEAWAPSTFTVEAHGAGAFPLLGHHANAACGTCHLGGQLTGLPTDCAGCHVDRHRGKLGDDCSACHTPSGFTPVAGFDHPAQTGFALTGAHARPCAACHTGAHGQAMASVADASCATCHAEQHGDLGRPCETCHDPGAAHAFAQPTPFDHKLTGFDLERRHRAHDCVACHPVGSGTPVPRCAACHLDPHAGQLGKRCDDCHRPDRWRLARFDHDLTAWPLRGRHFVAPCASCHTAQRWIGLPNQCWDCHAVEATRAPAVIEAHRFGRSDCSDCHSSWSWSR